MGGLEGLPFAAFFKTPDAHNSFERFRKEFPLPTDAGNPYPGDVWAERPVSLGRGGAGQARPPPSPGLSVSGAPHHSSECRSNLALTPHAPGPWPAPRTHSCTPCLPPPPPGGFPRPVCTVETAARQRLGARPGEVGDPRGPERREERRNSGKKEGGAAGYGVPGFAGALPGTGRTAGALAADLGPRS